MEIIEIITEEVLAFDDGETVLLLDSGDVEILDVAEQGPPGPAGGAAVEVNFAYGDATPATLTLVTAGKLVYGVQVHIKTPFDGTGAALVVGDAAQADRLMAASENDPTQIGSSATHPAHAYVADTPLLLGITPGAGATQGSGVLVLYIQQ